MWRGAVAIAVVVLLKLSTIRFGDAMNVAGVVAYPPPEEGGKEGEEEGEGR